VQRMRAHLDSVARHLGPEAVAGDPLAALRTALAEPKTARSRKALSHPRSQKELSK
jgi:hypothetical protein